jgi:3-deoxy-D-manno-octulosonic-acid transferase/heptosyltransferase-1
MNILIVKLSAIGDVIHTLPSLNAIRRRFPDAHITWLVEEAASGIVTSHSAVDRVLISDRKRWLKGLLGLSWSRNFCDIFRFLTALRDTRYDVVIDFQGLLKSAVMVGLARGRRKIGYDQTREYSYLVLNEKVPPFDMDKHAVFRYLHLAKEVNADTELIEFNVPCGPEHEQHIVSVLQQKGWVGEAIVAINPIAKWKTKLWTAENFSRVADRLLSELGVFVVFTGAGKDQPEIQNIRSKMCHGSADMSGLTDLKQLAALYGMSHCVITTDTGPMHLAAAVGTPVIALFGPTAPWRTGPFGEGHEIIRGAWSCSPCFKRECEPVKCMEDISPGQVLDAVKRVLKKASGQSVMDRLESRGSA